MKHLLSFRYVVLTENKNLRVHLLVAIGLTLGAWFLPILIAQNPSDVPPLRTSLSIVFSVCYLLFYVFLLGKNYLPFRLESNPLITAWIEAFSNNEILLARFLIFILMYVILATILMTPALGGILYFQHIQEVIFLSILTGTVLFFIVHFLQIQFTEPDLISFYSILAFLIYTGLSGVFFYMLFSFPWAPVSFRWIFYLSTGIFTGLMSISTYAGTLYSLKRCGMNLPAFRRTFTLFLLPIWFGGLFLFYGAYTYEITPQIKNLTSTSYNNLTPVGEWVMASGTFRRLFPIEFYYLYHPGKGTFRRLSPTWIIPMTPDIGIDGTYQPSISWFEKHLFTGKLVWHTLVLTQDGTVLKKYMFYPQFTSQWSISAHVSPNSKWVAFVYPSSNKAFIYELSTGIIIRTINNSGGRLLNGFFIKKDVYVQPEYFLAPHIHDPAQWNFTLVWHVYDVKSRRHKSYHTQLTLPKQPKHIELLQAIETLDLRIYLETTRTDKKQTIYVFFQKKEPFHIIEKSIPGETKDFIHYFSPVIFMKGHRIALKWKNGAFVLEIDGKEILQKENYLSGYQCDPERKLIFLSLAETFHKKGSPGVYLVNVETSQVLYSGEGMYITHHGKTCTYIRHGAFFYSLSGDIYKLNAHTLQVSRILPLQNSTD